MHHHWRRLHNQVSKMARRGVILVVRAIPSPPTFRPVRRPGSAAQTEVEAKMAQKQKGKAEKGGKGKKGKKQPAK